jgi:hypothetical protein
MTRWSVELFRAKPKGHEAAWNFLRVTPKDLDKGR